MSRTSRTSQAGVTLIELMIAVTLIAILATLAVPSFVDFRNRSAVRGAADQIVSFWGNARFEALRRNQLVKVGFVSGAGGICLGAATTTDPDDDAACDCFTAGACNVSSYPSTQGEWRGIRMPSNPTLGDDDADTQGVAVIDPRRGNLTDAADAGQLLIQSPASGNSDYRLNVAIDRNGRAVVCEPAATPSKLPQYVNRRC